MEGVDAERRIEVNWGSAPTLARVAFANRNEDNRIRLPVRPLALTPRARMTRRFTANLYLLLQRAVIAAIFLLPDLGSRTSTAAEPSEQPLERRFAELVRPFVKNYCLDCHSSDKPKAKLDL